MDSTAGYVRKLKEILSTEEDKDLLLGTYNYDEIFKIILPDYVEETNIRDLPSPTTKKETEPGQSLQSLHTPQKSQVISIDSLELCKSQSKSIEEWGNTLSVALRSQIGKCIP